MKDLKAIEKDNARVMYEWNAFEKECPGSYAEMSEACQQKAIDLAEKQGLRHRKLFGPCVVPPDRV